MAKDLTIIFVTFNSAKIIKSALGRINFAKYEVMIVDNASKDDTVKIISKEFPKINLTKNKQNLGFSRANNIALRKVKTPFALVLNADAIINEKVIDRIIKVMKENQQIAMAGPFVYYAENENLENEQICTHIKKSRHFSEDENCFFNQFITGAAMFMNMKLMKKIGFFDEGFFLYGEDNEIGKRVIKKGFKTAIVKDTKFHHLSGKSSEITEEERRKIIWHKFGWSKLYYTRRIWGIIPAYLKAIRMILKFSLLILRDFVKGRETSIVNKIALKGCVQFMFGIQAFDKNNNPRG